MITRNIRSPVKKQFDYDEYLELMEKKLRKKAAQPGVYFVSWNRDGDLVLVVVGKNEIPKRYKWYGVGQDSKEEFDYMLSWDKKYKGKGYRALRWLEQRFGRGEKLASLDEDKMTLQEIELRANELGLSASMSVNWNKFKAALYQLGYSGPRLVNLTYGEAKEILRKEYTKRYPRKMLSDKEFKDRLGKCYELSGGFVIDEDKPDMYLIHGSIEGFGHPRIGHAWVEYRDSELEKKMKATFKDMPEEVIKNAAIMVFDPVYGTPLPKDAYLAMFGAQEIKRYSKEEARSKMLSSGTYGPWYKESSKLAREIGEAEITLDIPIDATGHAMARLIRPGHMDVDESEVVSAVQKASNKLVAEFLKTGKSEWCIKDTSQDYLNIVLAVTKGNPIEFKVITVMKKKDFHAKPGTRTIVVSSIVDYPHETLDPVVWNLDVDPPILRDELKEEILSKLFDGLAKQFPSVDWFKELGDVNLTGSIGTYQYIPQSDIDVHIIVEDFDRLNEVGGRDTFFDDVQDFIRSEEMSGWLVGDHPVNYYLQIDKKQDLLGDAMYNLYTDAWVVIPARVPVQYDPEHKFKPVWEQTRDWMNTFTTGLMELQRDIKDIENLRSWLGRLGHDEIEWLEHRINKKIQEVNEDLDKIAQDFTDVHEERGKAYSEHLEPEEAFDDWMTSRSWAAGNIQWKFLEKYGLVVILANLRYIAKSEDLTPEEKAEEAKELLERFDLMFNKLGATITGYASLETGEAELAAEVNTLVSISDKIFLDDPDIIQYLKDMGYKDSQLVVPWDVRKGVNLFAEKQFMTSPPGRIIALCEVGGAYVKFGPYILVKDPKTCRIKSFTYQNKEFDAKGLLEYLKQGKTGGRMVARHLLKRSADNDTISVQQLLNEVGFQPDVFVDVVSEETEDTIIKKVIINTARYDVMPFLSNGKILAVLQAVADRLPLERDGKKLEWLFVAAEPVKGAMEIEWMKEHANAIAQSLGSTNFVELEDVGEWYYLSFWTDGLKIGGEWDDDSNDPDKFDEIRERLKALMNVKFPGKRWRCSSNEKGHWGLEIKKGSIKKAQIDATDARLLKTTFGKIGEEAMKSGLLDVAIAYQIGKRFVNQIVEDSKEEGRRPYWGTTIEAQDRPEDMTDVQRELYKGGFDYRSPRAWILDMGATMPAVDVETGETRMVIPRYGVWAFHTGKNKHQVAETSDDLQYLLNKYGLTEKDVHTISKKE